MSEQELAGIIAKNIRRVRRFKGFTQKKLAEKADVSLPTIKLIEAGKSNMRADTILKVTAALGIQLRQLFEQPKGLTQVRFRSLRKLKDREQILIDSERWLEDYSSLEEMLHIRSSNPYDELLRMKLEIWGDALPQELAALVREHLEMGDEPVRDICGLLSSLGIKIFPYVYHSEGFFGLSIGKADKGPAVVVNVWDRIPVERWIFSAAHEFAHLLLHLDSFDVAQQQENDQEERDANLFASHFLMPKGIFLKEWNETSGLSLLDRVFKVKRIFKVSYKTVLCRLQEFALADNAIWGKFNAHYKARYKLPLRYAEEPFNAQCWEFSSAIAETKAPNEQEGLLKYDFMEDNLSRLVRLAIEREEISVSRGAEILGIYVEEMRENMNSWMEPRRIDGI